jgi:hypothetical protein
MLGHSPYLGPYPGASSLVALAIYDLSDPAGDLAHLSLFHTARGEGWGAQADATWVKGWPWIKGDGVPIHCNSGAV